MKNDLYEDLKESVRCYICNNWHKNFPNINRPVCSIECSDKLASIINPINYDGQMF